MSSTKTGAPALLRPTAAAQLPVVTASTYPTPVRAAAAVEGRARGQLGEPYGLTRFGVNRTSLAPGAASALPHHHTAQDEFVYVLEGEPTLCFGEERIAMRPGDCMGFPMGQGIGHCLVNETKETVVFLEVGDRTMGDVVDYPRMDLMAKMNEQGKYLYIHEDGRSY